MASKNVSFSTIPSGIRSPGQYIEYNTTLALRSLPTNDQSLLIVGQRTAAGTVPALVPTDIYSSDQSALYFGEGSLIDIAVRAAIKANPYLSITAIAVDDDAAGVAAHGTVTFTGTATQDGAFALYVGRQRINIAVNTGDTAADVAAAMVTAIAQTPSLHVSGAAAAAVVTITAKNKGVTGNGIVLSQLNQAPGITAAIAAMAGGLNDPDPQPALDAVFASSYTLVAACWSQLDALTKIRTFADAISGAMEMRPCVVAAGFVGTISAGATLASSLNDGRITIGWYPNSASHVAEVAAGYAAVIGSEPDPARPFNTLPIAGLDIVPVDKRASRGEKEMALHEGLTPLEVGPDNNSVQIKRAVSSYLVNPQGVNDPSLLDITTIRSLDYSRKAWRERFALRFPRSKLAPRTPDQVRSEMLDVAYKLEDLEILEDIDTWKNSFIFEKDEQSIGQLNGKLPAPVVPGLHVFAAEIDLILS
ncbi:TPA: phage tail protein [Burkholderia vietnamiensis]|nr:phage tail protein [Burkholderia vietnamiensis]